MEEIVTLTQDLIRFKTMHSEPEEIERCTAFIEAYLDKYRIAYTPCRERGLPDHPGNARRQ